MQRLMHTYTCTPHAHRHEIKKSHLLENIACELEPCKVSRPEGLACLTPQPLYQGLLAPTFSFHSTRPFLPLLPFPCSCLRCACFLCSSVHRWSIAPFRSWLFIPCRPLYLQQHFPTTCFKHTSRWQHLQLQCISACLPVVHSLRLQMP